MTDLLDAARDFLTLYHRETGRGGLEARLAEVQEELRATGTYHLSSEELAHGARVAWRNGVRCIGRLPWRALQVRDLRHVQEPAEVFAEVLRHLELAFAGGHIQPMISVFSNEVRMLNPQLIRYAGYEQAEHGQGGASVLGDPAQARLTTRLIQAGWQPPEPRSAFDVLPLALTVRGELHFFDYPPGAVHEVPITHPDHPRLAELGLKWYAVPAVSDMVLEVGGQHFHCAPFNGWYMQTEIASRNFADQNRYNLLPQVARVLGLDTRRERTLWRDQALLVLNQAVLHSYAAAGVKMVDHHTAAEGFTRFERHEGEAGRPVLGRWSWLIPPMSPAATPIWKRDYPDTEISPNFRYRRDVPPPACPHHAPAGAAP